MSSLTTPTYVTKLALTSLRSLYFLSFHVLFSPVPALLALTSECRRRETFGTVPYPRSATYFFPKHRQTLENIFWRSIKTPRHRQSTTNLFFRKRRKQGWERDDRYATRNGNRTMARRIRRQSHETINSLTMMQRQRVAVAGEQLHAFRWIAASGGACGR
jgi:hypothetical protein